MAAAPYAAMLKVNLLSSSYDKFLLALNSKIANGELSPVAPFKYDANNAGTIYILDELKYLQNVLASTIVHLSAA